MGCIPDTGTSRCLHTPTQTDRATGNAHHRRLLLAAVGAVVAIGEKRVAAPPVPGAQWFGPLIGTCRAGDKRQYRRDKRPAALLLTEISAAGLKFARERREFVNLRLSE